MISIKCKIKNQIDVADYIRQFNNVKRFAYNRFLEKKSLSEVYHLSCKTLNNCELLDASFREAAVLKAKEIYDTSGDNKVIFGGRSNFNKLKYKKESAKPLRRNVSFYSQGRANFKGNRKFNFDLENNKVVFKPERKVKIEIKFEEVSKNQKKLLKKAQYLSQRKELSISVQVSETHIIFAIDESILQNQNYKPIKNRILALDSNPENIGLSIIDWIDPDTKTIIHKEVIDLKGLRDLSTNKKHHEILSVSQRIAKLAKHYQCEIVCFEKLNIKPKDNGKGKLYNRLVNNNWNRIKFFQNLTKWCNIFGIATQEVASEFSSFIGQLTNEHDVDMIAASIEISRRGFLFYNHYVAKRISSVNNEKVNIVYPEFNVSSLPTRWKKMVQDDDALGSWKKLYYHLKKSETSYRFSLKDWKQSKEFLRHKSRKSNVFLYFG
jgi:predicted transposase